MKSAILGIILAGIGFQSFSHAESRVEGHLRPLFCARENPLVVFTASTQTATVLGQTLNYSFTVKNTDYSGCLPSKFNLTMSYATGLTPKLSVSNVTLNPGETRTVTLQVAAIPLVDGRNYSILLTAKNEGAPQSFTTTQLYYAVALPTPCVRANPTATFSKPNQTATTALQTLDYIIAVTNNDSATCGVSNFTVAPLLESGLTSTMPFNKLILNPAQKSTALIRVSPISNLPNRSYSVAGVATNAFVTSKTATATGSYIVQVAAASVSADSISTEFAIPSIASSTQAEFMPYVMAQVSSLDPAMPTEAAKYEAARRWMEQGDFVEAMSELNR